MERHYYTQYSEHLQREMHVLVYGYTGVPIIVFPCQDSMCDNFENFGMIDVLQDYIDGGKIQLFSVDTVDKESWSDTWGDKGYRAWMQECYYRYIVDEVLPMVHEINGTGQLPLTLGCSLGATHAAIVFFRRPECSAVCLVCPAVMMPPISQMDGAMRICIIILLFIFWRICLQIIHISSCIMREKSFSA